MKSITLITGGARSGKSSFALDLARKNYERRVFIATAVAFDEEMKRRIVQHQKERGRLFQTLEEPVHLTETLSDLRSHQEGCHDAACRRATD